MTITAARANAARIGRILLRTQPLKVCNKFSIRCSSSVISSSSTFTPSNPTHLIFGANTDVGKTIVSAGLVRASLRSLDDLGRRSGDDPGNVHYIKPLQCGGSDEKFVERHATARDGDSDDSDSDDGIGQMGGLVCTTLFEWDTPASPHVSSRLENAPASDDEVLADLRETLMDFTWDAEAIFVETAGGVLSPSSASPLNVEAWHSREGGDGGGALEGKGFLREVSEELVASPLPTSWWGWSTQADLYSPIYSGLDIPVLLVGDGRLGGISVTLSSLEALEARGYSVHGIVLIDDGHFGPDNARALEEYIASADGRRERRRKLGVNVEKGINVEKNGEIGVHLLPAVPPMPEPLDGWFAKQEVEDTFQKLNTVLVDRCQQR